MGKKDNIDQFPYHGTLILKGDKGSHTIGVACLLSIKVKDQSPETMEGTAWVNSAAEPRSKAWLYCKFKAQRLPTGRQIQVEGDNLAALIAERLHGVKG